MGFTIGMPSLKLSNIEGKGGKHCGNFAKVAKEALKERQGLDMDINPELANQNMYLGYETAAELIDYSDKHIDAINKWRSENGERPCDRRKLKNDTVVMCATVIKPPAEMMSELSDEQQRRFLQDSFEIFKGFVGNENIKAAAFHFDERVPHLHIFWEPMTDEHRICAKEMHNLKFFGKLNREMPKQLREKGWAMIDDCQAYDKAEEEQKRLEMGEEKYKEYRKEQRAKRGQDSRHFKYEIEKKIAEKKKELTKLENALSEANIDTKETKTVKSVFGYKEVPKTDEEIQHDKAIAGAKLVLKRETKVAKREVECSTREQELSAQISAARTDEQQKANERQRIAIARARKEERAKAEHELKLLQIERDNAVTAQANLQRQLEQEREHSAEIMKLATDYVYMADEMQLPSDPTKHAYVKKLLSDYERRWKVMQSSEYVQKQTMIHNKPI